MSGRVSEIGPINRGGEICNVAQVAVGIPDAVVAEVRSTVASSDREQHYGVLDGWRGVSILAVLACHLLPVGPHVWRLNDVAGNLGMAVFFCLSGFLITTFLMRHSSVREFLIRRLCRILPLAWLALPIGLWIEQAPRELYVPNFLFFANLP